jgi:hypothetical protein
MRNNKKLTINEINIQVLSKNISCISGQYFNNKSLLTWKCLICKYEFVYSKNFIDRSFRKCTNCKNIDAIKLANKVANQNGGECLTVIYTGSHDKIICRCKWGHTFEIAYNNMVNLGYWCSLCNDSKYICESIVRVYFEKLFNENFIKIRPDWLRKDNNYKLELDGFCEKLKIAFEHNGEYHYVSGNWNKDLENVQQNDALKMHMCKINNIKLIVIPSLFHKTPLNKLREYILNDCYRQSIYVPFPDIDIKVW